MYYIPPSNPTDYNPYTNGESATWLHDISDYYPDPNLIRKRAAEFNHLGDYLSNNLPAALNAFTSIPWTGEAGFYATKAYGSLTLLLGNCAGYCYKMAMNLDQYAKEMEKAIAQARANEVIQTVVIVFTAVTIVGSLILAPVVAPVLAPLTSVIGALGAEIVVGAIDGVVNEAISNIVIPVIVDKLYNVPNNINWTTEGENLAEQAILGGVFGGVNRLVNGLGRGAEIAAGVVEGFANEAISNIVVPSIINGTANNPNVDWSAEGKSLAEQSIIGGAIAGLSGGKDHVAEVPMSTDTVNVHVGTDVNPVGPSIPHVTDGMPSTDVPPLPNSDLGPKISFNGVGVGSGLDLHAGPVATFHEGGAPVETAWTPAGGSPVRTDSSFGTGMPHDDALTVGSGTSTGVDHIPTDSVSVGSGLDLHGGPAATFREGGSPVVDTAVTPGVGSHETLTVGTGTGTSTGVDHVVSDSVGTGGPVVDKSLTPGGGSHDALTVGTDASTVLDHSSASPTTFSDVSSVAGPSSFGGTRPVTTDHATTLDLGGASSRATSDHVVASGSETSPSSRPAASESGAKVGTDTSPVSTDMTSPAVRTSGAEVSPTAAHSDVPSGGGDSAARPGTGGDKTAVDTHAETWPTVKSHDGASRLDGSSGGSEVLDGHEYVPGEKNPYDRWSDSTLPDGGRSGLGTTDSHASTSEPRVDAPVRDSAGESPLHSGPESTGVDRASTVDGTGHDSASVIKDGVSEASFSGEASRSRPEFGGERSTTEPATSGGAHDEHSLTGHDHAGDDRSTSVASEHLSAKDHHDGVGSTPGAEHAGIHISDHPSERTWSEWARGLHKPFHSNSPAHEAGLATKHGAHETAKIFDDIAHRSRDELPPNERLVNLKQSELKSMLHNKGDAPGQRAAAYEIIRRKMGKELRWTQVEATEALLRDEIVNMAAGEGKSLVFLSTALRRAVSDDTHVVQLFTTRDNLAARDATKYKKLLEPFGVDVVRMSPEGARDPVHGWPTIYVGTPEEAGFSFLRDKPIPGRHAFVDEYDELAHGNAHYILSEGVQGPAPKEVADSVRWARDVLNEHLDRSHFGYRETLTGFRRGAKVSLTEEGVRKVKDLLGDKPFTEEMHKRLDMAAHAEWEFRAGRHYEVHDDKVHIIDQITHKVLSDPKTSSESRWNDGLAQAVEAKHDLTVRDDPSNSNSVTLKELFSKDRYDHIAGASGTAKDNEVLFRKRGLPGDKVTDIPRYHDLKLHFGEDKVYETVDDKLAGIAADVKARQETGQPVLIITGHNDEVGPLSDMLTKAGVQHNKIDAKWFLEHGKDAESAFQKIADSAGEQHGVWLANGTAGRGVDIPLTKEAKELGGLHVVVTDRSALTHDVDIQAENRTGRNGEAGSVQYYVSKEDDIYGVHESPDIQHAIIRYTHAADAYRADPLSHQAAEEFIHAQNAMRALIPHLQTIAHAKLLGMRLPSVPPPTVPSAGPSIATPGVGALPAPAPESPPPAPESSHTAGHGVHGDGAHPVDSAKAGPSHAHGVGGAGHSSAGTHGGAEHSGASTHAGAGTHNGAGTHAGAGTHSGAGTHAGAGMHSGAGTHAGAGMHSGAGTHAGAGMHSGAGTHAGAGAHAGAGTHIGAGHGGADGRHGADRHAESSESGARSVHSDAGRPPTALEREARFATEHKLHDVADMFHDIAHRSRPELPAHERLTELAPHQLTDMLLHGNSRAQTAAIYELVRRYEHKEMRWTQLAALTAMSRGEVVNMAAGEGKSLVFLAYAAQKAVAEGVGAVQVITTRDNLASREYHAYKELFEKFGIDVVRMNPEGNVPLPVEGKPTIYVGTHEDVAFSFLRGNPVPGRHVAMDEIDELLVYSDGTFILSEGVQEPAQQHVVDSVHWARTFLHQLTESDFRPHPRQPRGGPIVLTERGLRKVERVLGRELADEERSRLNMAAAARWEYVENKHYVVHNDKVYIIDQVTHKVMADAKTASESRWNGGLAQAVEAKHGLTIRDDPASDGTNTITARELFSATNYDGLTGASGTANGKEDLLTKLGLPGGMVKITNVARYFASKLKIGKDKVFRTTEDKLKQIARDVKARQASGQPQLVLVHTNEQVAPLSDLLHGMDVEHVMIDAKWFLEQGADSEAAFQEIVDQAGQLGKVLVVNMQGARGVDIPLSDEAKERGGLHVIVTARSTLRDIDIQAENRAGRNGQKGSVQYYVSPKDEIFDLPDNRGVELVTVRYGKAATTYAEDPMSETAAAEMTHAQRAMREMIPDLQHEAAARIGVHMPKEMPKEAGPGGALSRLGPLTTLPAEPAAGMGVRFGGNRWYFTSGSENPGDWVAAQSLAAAFPDFEVVYVHADPVADLVQVSGEPLAYPEFAGRFAELSGSTKPILLMMCGGAVAPAGGASMAQVLHAATGRGVLTTGGFIVQSKDGLHPVPFKLDASGRPEWSVPGPGEPLTDQTVGWQYIPSTSESSDGEPILLGHDLADAINRMGLRAPTSLASPSLAAPVAWVLAGRGRSPR